jgi:hypothetical protein
LLNLHSTNPHLNGNALDHPHHVAAELQPFGLALENAGDIPCYRIKLQSSTMHIESQPGYARYGL